MQWVFYQHHEGVDVATEPDAIFPLFIMNQLPPGDQKLLLESLGPACRASLKTLPSMVWRILKQPIKTPPNLISNVSRGLIFALLKSIWQYESVHLSLAMPASANRFFHVPEVVEAASKAWQHQASEVSCHAKLAETFRMQFTLPCKSLFNVICSQGIGSAYLSTH